MLAQRVATKVMQLVLSLTLVLMVIGLLLKLLKINDTANTLYISKEAIFNSFSAPNGYLFFSVAAALLLLSPIMVSIGTGFAFIKEGNNKMAAVSFGLFAILAASILFRLLS